MAPSSSQSPPLNFSPHYGHAQSHWTGPDLDARVLNNSNVGSWLCDRGLYQRYISQISGLDPGLKKSDPENVGAPLSDRVATATVLRFDESSKTAFEISLPDAGTHMQSLQLHLNSSHSNRKMIYLIEGLNTTMIAILGRHFQMDPSFFLEHERTSVFGRYASGVSLAPSLPSSVDHTNFCIKYYDLREIGPMVDSFSVSCADSGRHISMNRFDGKWESPALVDRKCSVWNQHTADGGWNVIVLCDPPLSRVHVWRPWPDGKQGPQIVPLTTTLPFQGGYKDFVPRPSVLKDPPVGPLRDSLVTDLRYYLTHHTPLLPDEVTTNPTHISLFAKKIIASQYLQLINYTTSLLTSLEWPLSRQDDFTGFQVRWVESRWSDNQTMSRRCNGYVDDVTNILIRLGIPFDLPNPPSPFPVSVTNSTNRPSSATSPPQWQNTTLDFQYILHRMASTKARADLLNANVTGLTGIVGNAQALREAKRSLREAKSVKTLTLIAMVFIPLAFTTGLFSMSEKFSPGSGGFTTFWAVSLPLVVVVFCAALLLDLGYDAEGIWTLGTFVKGVERIVMRKDKKS